MTALRKTVSVESLMMIIPANSPWELLTGTARGITDWPLDSSTSTSPARAPDSFAVRHKGSSSKRGRTPELVAAIVVPYTFVTITSMTGRVPSFCS